MTDLLTEMLRALIMRWCRQRNFPLKYRPPHVIGWDARVMAAMSNVIFGGA